MKKLNPYHAVVFAAGTGSRMIELTSSIPKCLLPVANKPMIWYPLNYLENAGFTEATVIVPAKCLTHVQRLISSVYRFSIKIDLFSLPSDQESCGTADALRMISDRIENDIVLLSCDLITDIPLNDLLAAHQLSDASVTCLFASNAIHGTAPGPKSKRRIERDIIGIVQEEQRLVFLTSEDDLDEDSLSFSKSWIAKFPRVNFTTKLTDCHLYVLKKWTLDALKQNPECSSIKADFVPYLVNLQQYRNLNSDLKSLLQRDKLEQEIFEYSHTLADFEDLIRCVAYVPKADQYTFCARLNNYGTYFEANKQVVKSFPKWFPQASASVPNDCTVGQGATVHGNMKRSVIGRDCVLAEKSKVMNSVLMDCVRVGEGATITNSIICHSADIGEKAEVKDSIVGKIVSEIIGDTSQMMDI